MYAVGTGVGHGLPHLHRFLKPMSLFSVCSLLSVHIMICSMCYLAASLCESKPPPTHLLLGKVF